MAISPRASEAKSCRVRFHGRDEVGIVRDGLPPNALDIRRLLDLLLGSLTVLHPHHAVGLDDQVQDVLLGHLRRDALLREHDGQSLVLREDRRHQEEDEQQEGDVGHGRGRDLVADLRLFLVQDRHECLDLVSAEVSGLVVRERATAA
jgi:hypothetical protein